MYKSRFVLIAAAVAGAVATGLTGTAKAQVAAAEDTETPQVIVTATKRRESVTDVVGPISAVTGDQLAKMNANSLEDYITRLPGVVFNDYQPGVSEVVIRGIAATTYHEQGQTTTGYYLNEVDVEEPNWPIVIPDVDTFDLERVEVLRGPQGTLFGSSTLGGLVNYVAKTADVHKFDLAAEGLLGSTENADGQVNYAGKAMVNIPLIADKLAVRVMALQREDVGYIDNVGLTPAEKATNNFLTRGLRASIVFEPVEGTKITYLGTYQDTKLDDQTYISYDHTYIRSTGIKEPQRTSFFLNSLRLDQDVGFATLTVLGSEDRKTNFTRFADPYGYVTGVVSGPDIAFDDAHADATIYTAEARLASKDGSGPLRWLVGTSYLRATKYSFDQMWAPGADAYIDANPDQFAYPSGVIAPNDRIYGYLTNTLNTDFGVFGEATLKLPAGFELTAGGRYYHTVAEGDVDNLASFVSGSPVDLTGHVNQGESGFTPKASIAWHPGKDLLAYFLYSKGYRVGGINPNAGLLPSIQNAYKSDSVDNYELGVKTSPWHGLVTLDASIFDMKWKDIQAREFGPAPMYYSYVENAASAEVKGIEFAAAVKPARGLSYSTSVTYEDAQLTSLLPYAFAADGIGYASGSTLPGSSKWSISNDLEYAFLGVPFIPTLQLAHRFLSSAPVAFGTDVTRGNFHIIDARLGFSLPGNLRLTGFVDNLTNRYGILNGPFSAQTAPAYSVVRPRTYGLRVDWSLQ